MLSALSQRGIGGISEPDRIRCLHTWYAAHLVVPNGIGDIVESLFIDASPRPMIAALSLQPFSNTTAWAGNRTCQTTGNYLPARPEDLIAVLA